MRPLVTATTKKTLVLLGLGVVAAVLAGWQINRLYRPRPFDIRSARLTKLDPARRSGEIEFLHPKSGQATTVAAREIPADCEVWINGIRAAVQDLRVGDTVAVRGLFYPGDQSARPNTIRATRPAGLTKSTSQPTATADTP